jgi:predicted DNA-binding protein YlxM (UPF0122 family)
MDGKTIKQIADELRVSKQAVWQRVKRSAELSAILADHSETVNGTVYVDDVLEQRIKEQYPERPTVDETPINIGETVDETPINIGETVDETGVNVDKTTVNKAKNVDETSSEIDVNTLIVTLQNTVDTLQQQLTVKDKQIDELTVMLKASQEQQATLVSALTAAQALHAGTIQERLTERSGGSEEGAMAAENVSDLDEGEPAREPQQERRGFFARIFGRK